MSLIGTGVPLDLEVEQEDDTNLYIIDRADDTQFTAALDLMNDAIDVDPGV